MNHLLSALSAIDYNLLLWIQNNLRNDVATVLFRFITVLGNGGMIWILFDLLLLRKKETRAAGIAAAASLAIATILGVGVLKPLIARPRPFVSHPAIQALITESGYSFPSGHAITAFANATAIAAMTKKSYSIPLFALAALIGFSRIYLGVHYPGDILAGAVLGILSGIAVCKLIQVVWKTHCEKVPAFH